jgi:hypothetical protein
MSEPEYCDCVFPEESPYDDNICIACGGKLNDNDEEKENNDG